MHDIGRALGDSEHASSWEDVARDLDRLKAHIWEGYMNTREAN